MRGQVTPSESSASSEETTEPEEDSERTDTDEEGRKIKEELKSRPAVSAQRKQWEEISEGLKKKEIRAKRKEERQSERKVRKEQQEREMAEQREQQRLKRERERLQKAIWPQRGRGKGYKRL